MLALVPPGAIACGRIAMGQVRRSGEQGCALALAGAVLGRVITACIALVVLLRAAVLPSIVVGRLASLPLALRGA